MASKLNRQQRTRVVRAELLLLRPLAARAHVPIAPGDPQAGARLDPPPALESWTVNEPDSVDRDGGSYPIHEWYVRIGHERVTVDRGTSKAVSALPFSVEPVRTAQGFELQGTQSVVAVVDGYLVGFDAGEFGGGLWWFSADGRRRRKVAPAPSLISGEWFANNVHGLVVLDQDELSFERLTHLTLDARRVVRVHPEREGHWYGSEFARLSACPHGIVAESESRWLFVTTSGVWRIDAQRHVDPVFRPPRGMLQYPNNRVRNQAGIVHAGMRYWVLRMTPKEAGNYAVQVLLPPPE